MRVVIVGAGADGSHLAERLSSEGQDVSVIELDPDRANGLRERLDALVITGNGASPAILRKAGADKADLLVAVSDNDAANIVACQTGAALGASRTVVRVEDSDLHSVLPTLGLETVIDSRGTTAREIVRLLRWSGVSDLAEFGDGRIAVVGGIVQPASSAIGRSLAELRHEIEGWSFVVVAVIRGGKTIVGRGDTVLQTFDHVLVSAPMAQVGLVMDLFDLRREAVGRVVMVGITRVTEVAAGLLTAEGRDVVVVDSDADSARVFAERNRGVEVVTGDPTNPKTLRSVGVGNGDAVLGLTMRDEVNVFVCLIGGALGATATIARFHRLSLFGLLPSAGIDATVSSRLAAANEVLRFVRRGRILSVATFMSSDLEAIEIEVAPHARAVGTPVSDLPLPAASVVGAFLRDGKVHIPEGRTRFEVGDRVVVVASRDAVHEVEQLFTP